MDQQCLATEPASETFGRGVGLAAHPAKLPAYVSAVGLPSVLPHTVLNYLSNKSPALAQPVVGAEEENRTVEPQRSTGLLLRWTQIRSCA